MKNWLSFALLSLIFFASAPVLAADVEHKAAVQPPKTEEAKAVDPNASQSPTKSAEPAVKTVEPSAPATAQPAAQTDDAEEILKEITIHKRPDDFAGAQQLALQNREERMTMLHKAIACVQSAKSLEDIYACQAEERKSLDKIWLSYCDTTVSFLGIKRKMTRDGLAFKGGEDTMADVKPKASECEKALSAVTGRPIPQRPSPAAE